MNEDKLLIKIAQMYYKENKNQNKISKELNIHRSTISRLLKRSREEGIVKITINYEMAGIYSLEAQLEELYQIRKVIIIPDSIEMDDNQKNTLLAAAANDYLHTILKDGMIIGFSWGRTMSALSQGLKDFRLKDITCIPMLGGPSGRLDSEYHVNTITYEASKHLNGRAYLIDAPAFPENIKLKKALMEDTYNQELIQCWRELNVAIFGIGTPSLKESTRWRGFYGEDVFESLEEKQIAGDIVSRFFDNKGHHIPNELNDRIIGIDITELKRVEYRVCLASSTNKVLAIRAGLLGNYINVLVTTQAIAEELLQ